MYSPYIINTPKSAGEAVAWQREMCGRVRVFDDYGDVKTVAGIDVGYDIRKGMSRAALVVMDIDTLVVRDSLVALDDTPFPYIPGLLSFREAPVIGKVLGQLDDMPDLLMLDGHGIAHPRGLGIAAHIGVLTGLPSIGVAKSVLCGQFEDIAPEKGSRAPLIYKDKMVGTAYRSRNNVAPIFISPGHRIGHDSAVRFVERFLIKYRLPEPTRLADKLSKIPR